MKNPFDEETVMSQQATDRRRDARPTAGQAVRRKERAERERGLEGLAVIVLTALGERDDDDDKGLSVREAVESVREVTRLRHLAQDPPGRMSARRSVRPAWLRCATVDDQAAVNTRLAGMSRRRSGRRHQMDGAAQAP